MYSWKNTFILPVLPKIFKGPTSLKSCRFLSEDKSEKHFFKKENEREWTPMLAAFATKRNQFPDLHKYNPLTVSKFRLQEWKSRMLREAEIMGQKFIKERHDILGSDLATAHFIVHRGGKVKFWGDERWISLKEGEDTCKELPRKYVRELYLEAVDASRVPLRYEGLDNLVRLARLRWLSFRECPHVDNWFVDRISGEFKDSLEYLDLGDCPGVTHQALACIYRFNNLRVLDLTNVVNSTAFEFACLLLEDAFPNLSIQGVKYVSVDEDLK